MFTRMKRNDVSGWSLIAAVAVVAGVSAWYGEAAVHAAPARAAVAKLPVLQQVGYAGQVSPAVTGQYPVTFRLFDASNNLLHEETITADIRQGRFQVFVGTKADLSSSLRTSKQMKVFFQGSMLDSLAVVHASQDEVLADAPRFSNLHAVIITDGPIAPAVVPEALDGKCSLIQTGFFTVPVTNSNPSTSCGGCSGGVQVSCGYLFLTTPSNGVFPYSVFPQNLSIWQVSYQVGSIPATLQLYGICCQ